MFCRLKPCMKPCSCDGVLPCSHRAKRPSIASIVANQSRRAASYIGAGAAIATPDQAPAGVPPPLRRPISHDTRAQFTGAQ